MPCSNWIASGTIPGAEAGAVAVAGGFSSPPPPAPPQKTLSPPHKIPFLRVPLFFFFVFSKGVPPPHPPSFQSSAPGLCLPIFPRNLFLKIIMGLAPRFLGRV